MKKWVRKVETRKGYRFRAIGYDNNIKLAVLSVGTAASFSFLEQKTCVLIDSTEDIDKIINLLNALKKTFPSINN